jgi:hypothetical protein
MFAKRIKMSVFYVLVFALCATAVEGQTGAGTSPTVVRHPEDVITALGTFLELSAAAHGDPQPTIQWQVAAPNSETFVNTGRESVSVTIFFGGLVTESVHGKRYRAVFRNAFGTAISNEARVTVLPSFGVNRGNRLTIGAVRGADRLLSQTAVQSVHFFQSGGLLVNWTVTVDQPWLRVNPTSGSGPGDVSVSVAFDPSLLESGSVTGRVSFHATGIPRGDRPASKQSFRRL